MSHLHHFQVLEINVVSAQDIAPVQKTRSMQTYAVAWVNPERKLTTRVDGSGHTNPTWNDKFVFRVDDKFLDSENSAVTIEIYAVSWLRDTLVGTVRILVHNLLPTSSRTPQGSAIRFVALQIRRPSGRPQGILNLGVTLLDSTMRSMPLFGQFTASALGYKDLMGETTEALRPNSQAQKDLEENSSRIKVLRRTQSEISLPVSEGKAPKARSMVHGGSTLNGSSLNGSFLNGDLNGSTVNGSIVWGPPRPGGSVCSDVGPSPSVVAAAMAKIYRDDDVSSSILGEWIVNRREEGLKSKIQRWRSEIPVRYENDYRKTKPKPSKSSRHPKQRNGPGLFSCFGNAYGCEFTIVCGTNSNNKKRYSKNTNLPIAPYEDNASQSYV